MDETEDPFLTVGEVADMLRLNQPTVRNTIDRGELVAVRVGPRRVRIRKSDLDRWISESAAQAAVQAAAGNDDLRPALQRLAVAATKLARALPRR